jgi:hypothetical protein
MPFGFSAKLNEVKTFIMAAIGSLVVLAVLSASIFPLMAIVYRPQHPIIQYNLDRYHDWINYGDTVPRMDSYTGVASKIPTASGLGWINGLHNRQLIYSPNFIADYNQCLSRALFTTRKHPGFHARMSICHHPPYNIRVGGHAGAPDEEFTVDIRLFGTNAEGSMKSTDRGIALTWNQYVSLVKNFKWVEGFILHNGRYDYNQHDDYDTAVDDPNHINATPPNDEQQQQRKIRLGLDTAHGIDVLYRNSSDSSTQRNITHGSPPRGSVIF